MPRRKSNHLERISLKITDWMGTTQALVVHTCLFFSAFALIALGANANTVMLVVTTAVSLEAIYLALFIQMTVNRQTKKITSVERDIDAIQEDVEAIEEIQEDLTELQVAERQEEIGTDQDFAKTETALKSIESQLAQLHATIGHLKAHITPTAPTSE